MFATTKEATTPSWKEIGRLAEVVGLPNDKYRSPQSDSVLDKSVAIQLFQKLFRDLLLESKQISQSDHPGQLLTKKLLTAITELLPRLPYDIGRIADGLTVIRFISSPSNRSNSTTNQELERLSISVISKLIDNLVLDSVARGNIISKWCNEGIETEGARAMLSNSIRLSALSGLSETLIYSGDIGLEFAKPLLSQFNSEPYHALSTLYSISKLNVSKKGNDLSYFKVNHIKIGAEQLVEALNKRFQELKPQVLELLDQVLTVIASEALKKEINNSIDNQLALRLQLLNFDPIQCLDFGASEVLPTTLGPVRNRVVAEIDQRVVADMLRFTLSGWGVLPSDRANGRSVDSIDAILEIRRQLNTY